MLFEDLGLTPQTLKAIEERGYTQPTPIQEKAIPAILMMRDVVGLAQTGTGKTASFTLPMIEVLHDGRARARMPRSLVLAPTRELAAQVAENFDIYGKYHKLTKALLVGGESMGEQLKQLGRGVDVLIATPGRLLDLFERGALLLGDIKILVIDEADRMLDMGFIPDIERIVSLVPASRQTLLFSATMPPEIKKLSDKFLSNPKTVSVAPPASTADTVEQFLVHSSPKKKKDDLNALIEQEEVKNAFVFCNRKRDVDSLAVWLKNKNHAAAPLHGDMPQAVRTQTLKEFKDGKVKLLVCSDVAARGLDVSAVSHVFNFDPPMNADDYVHRIGRTGRAGQTGRAWMLTTPADEKFLDAIERLIKEKIPVVKLSSSSSSSSAVAKGERDTGSAALSARSDKGREENTRPDKRSADRRRPRRTDKSDGADDRDVVGFGDDVPAFLK